MCVHWMTSESYIKICCGSRDILQTWRKQNKTKNTHERKNIISPLPLTAGDIVNVCVSHKSVLCKKPLFQTHPDLLSLSVFLQLKPRVFFMASSVHGILTSPSYSSVQQWLRITSNCLVGPFLSHVSPNSTLLTSGIWLSQTLTHTQAGRQTNREDVEREREKKEILRDRKRHEPFQSTGMWITANLFITRGPLFVWQNNQHTLVRRGKIAIHAQKTWQG